MSESPIKNLSSNHFKSYTITGIGKGSTVQMKTNTHHNLSTDLPLHMGGKNTAPQPVEYLLAALVGCTQATAVFVGRNMTPRVVIDKMEFDIKAKRDQRGALQLPVDKFPEVPARLQCVEGAVKIFLKDGGTLSREKLNTLMEQTEVRCPIANMMVASGCVLDIEWLDGNRQ